MSDETIPPTAAHEPAWRPLRSLQRRVAGVLIEKAKTTADAYPMSLNALTSGCNQKSNRSPQMKVSPDDVEQSLDELREMGAVTEIQGSGRVAKYRHRMYEWLGVEKTELAVMAELMLRGAQTVGELRTRASRMEQIAGLDELRPILRTLIDRKLVIPLSPEGRGQIVTHGLYPANELAEVKARVGVHVASEASTPSELASEPRPLDSAVGASQVSQQDFDGLRNDVAELKEELLRMRDQLGKLQQMLDQ